MPSTNSASTVIPRGTPNAAFAQLSSNAATTRSGTTATLTMASTATLTTNDWCLIQGHDIEEYNGVFQITVASGTTITYTIKQDPGASSGTTVMTVDKVTLGTVAVDMSTSYDGLIYGGIQNGNTAPGVAAQVWLGQSATSAAADYVWRPLSAGDLTAKSWSPFSVTLKPGLFYNIAVCRNTTNAVECFALATKMTGA
jgi:hypothetical protein